MERGTKLHVASSFLKTNSGAMRPYLEDDGFAYIANFKGGDPKDENNYEMIQVNAASLRYDEWRTLDRAVVKIAEQRLVGFDDLRANGLVYNLANAMGTTVLTWEEMSDALDAVISIDPIRKGDNDTVVFDNRSIPIPIVHADYMLSERLLQQSRKIGNSLSTLNAERATRKVSEQLEDMLFGSTSSLTYGGGTIHSYLSHPDINDLPFASAGEYWNDPSKTPEQIIEDVIAMKQTLIDDLHYGPYMVYIPTGYDTVMDKDYSVSGGSSMTIMERIKKIDRIQDIKVVDRLAADTVLMVQMTSDVVDLVDGMPIQNVEWNTDGGFVRNYKVMTIQVPRVKSDFNKRSGICKLS